MGTGGGRPRTQVGDFGLSVLLEDEGVPSSGRKFTSNSGRLPIKWLAVEALLRHEFSTKSDVWSFGMLLYEMYSFGETPFGAVPTREMGDHLKAGCRPDKPELCPDNMYSIMRACWAGEPEDRPSFDRILPDLTKALEEKAKGECGRGKS